MICFICIKNINIFITVCKEKRSCYTELARRRSVSQYEKYRHAPNGDIIGSVRKWA